MNRQLLFIHSGLCNAMKKFILKILNNKILFEKVIIKCLIQSKEEEEYLYRWKLFNKFKFFNIYIHNFAKPDSTVFHDHPWDFVSVVLSGSYKEKRPGELTTHRKAGSIMFRTAEASHYVESLEGDVWTLVIRGPYRRTWGFWTTEGWVDHESYKKLLLDVTVNP